MSLLRERPPFAAKLGCWRELDFYQAGFAFAAMAEALIKDRAEHPFLFCSIPIGPCVAADVVRAARAADNRDALVSFCHAETLPLPNGRSKMARPGWSEILDQLRGGSYSIGRTIVRPSLS